MHQQTGTHFELAAALQTFRNFLVFSAECYLEVCSLLPFSGVPDRIAKIMMGLIWKKSSIEPLFILQEVYTMPRVYQYHILRISGIRPSLHSVKRNTNHFYALLQIIILVIFLDNVKVLPVIKDAQQRHGLRHGDYQRYR